MFTYTVEMPNGTSKVVTSTHSDSTVALIVTRTYTNHSDFIVYAFQDEKEANRLAPYKRRKHNIYGVRTATTSIVPLKKIDA